MLALRWFENNYMKLNTDKCHLIVPDCKYEQVWANTRKYSISKDNDVKLLWITIDSNLLKLCIKANQTLRGLLE